VPKEPGTRSDKSLTHPRASPSVGFPTAGLIYKDQSGAFFVAPAPISDPNPVACNLIGRAAARTKEASVEAIAAALLRSVPKRPAASSSMPDTGLRVNYCETCCLTYLWAKGEPTSGLELLT
jgi:hypothetical protein